jgi:transcriptional regulator with XRE-family HTH domain
MNQYETGKHTPDHQMLYHVGKVLEVPVAYFYADSDELVELIMDYHRASKNKKRAAHKALVNNCW